jgi:hypothetical protein
VLLNELAGLLPVVLVEDDRLPACGERAVPVEVDGGGCSRRIRRRGVAAAVIPAHDGVTGHGPAEGMDAARVPADRKPG